MSTVDLSKIWPEWEVDEKPLGRGSYGTVYKAVRRDHDLETYSAIKVISIPQNESEIDSLRSEGLSIDSTRTYFQEIVNDFVSEIRLMESFKGVQNIVSVEDYKVIEKTEEIGWDIYIRMELLTPFVSYLSDKNLSEAEVVKLGSDICTALELCSQRNVIHRDIKPQNIFINQFGHFKLGDFGIARKLGNITGGLSQKGTPSYMAPEVAKGLQYDATVDLYSLGLVLYQLLNKNRLPFLDTERQLLSPSEREIAYKKRLDGEPLPKPCDASEYISQVILCACDPDPDKRFKSAAAMKKALMNAADGPGFDPDKTMKLHFDEPTPERRDPQLEPQPLAQLQPQAQPQSQTGIKVNKPVETFGKKKKSRLPILIAVVLVIALAAGGLVYFYPEFYEKIDVTKYFSKEAEVSESSETAKIVETTEVEDNDANIESIEKTKETEETEKTVSKEEDRGSKSETKEVEAVTRETENLDTPSAPGGPNAPGAYKPDNNPDETERATDENEKEVPDNRQGDEQENTEPQRFLEICPPYQTSDYVDTYKGNASFRMGGDQYKDGITMDTNWGHQWWFLTNLKKEYSELQFWLGHVDGSIMKDTGLEIYLDDKLVESYDVPCAGLPQLISVPVSGASQLKVVCTGGGAKIGLGNMTIKRTEGDQSKGSKDNDNKEPAEDDSMEKYLDACPPYQTSDYVDTYKGNASFRMGGDQYKDGITMDTNWGHQWWFLTNLKKEYSELQFWLGHVDGSIMNNTTLEIYLDDKLVESYDVPCAGLPQLISVPVSGASQLKVVCTGGGATIGLGDMKIK